MESATPSAQRVNIHAADARASPWLHRFLPLVQAGGRVLDLAAGEGRHTGFLLAQGFNVTAADRKVAELKARFGAEPRCTIVEIDLEDGGPWQLGGGFGAVLVSLYLHRPLFPYIAAALAPGGVLIYETFMRGNERFGRPTNPNFLLQPNELFDTFARELTVVAFEQGEVTLPKPAMMQRIAAVKAETADVP